MAFICFMYVLGVLVGLVGLASNPSPFYGALTLVVVAAAGCLGVLAFGGAFLGIVLLLIYLGGMLVVFAYAAALAAEVYPESWRSLATCSAIFLYVLGLIAASSLVWEGWGEFSWVTVNEQVEFSLLPADVEGVALMYGEGAGFLILAVWALLLTLFVVLELTRGLSRGTIRAI